MQAVLPSGERSPHGWLRVLGCVFLLSACGSSNQKGGTFAIGAGPTHFSTTGDADIGRFAERSDIGGPSPGDLRFKKSVCDGMDLTPEQDYLAANDLTAFLDQQSIPYETRALRPNLVIVKVKSKDAENLELRVAVLDSAEAAATELNAALLEHGQGSWGFHRSNLSVLGPIGSPDDIVQVTAKMRLSCWGTVLMAARDDTFALGGGYIEF